MTLIIKVAEILQCFISALIAFIAICASQGLWHS